ncbi:HAD domain-containing protein [Dactylosporangium sp. NPDC049140]|uniref:HAD domain-containing protein n=1 Tax=Dactylosporangium sp. NPDC049140 TaxID=3155647 RepID=UPI0034017C3C
MGSKPLLFLDVDGPLIPLAHRGADPHPAAAAAAARHGNPLLARVDPADGPRLLALGCDLVWATTWAADANEVIGPLLGLPRLPVVAWSADDEVDPDGRHWKTRDVVAWAAGRPFVWVDDEITAADRTFVARHHTAPALLHRVMGRAGLTAADFDAIRDWAAA